MIPECTTTRDDLVAAALDIAGGPVRLHDLADGLRLDVPAVAGALHRLYRRRLVRPTPNGWRAVPSPTLETIGAPPRGADHPTV